MMEFTISLENFETLKRDILRTEFPATITITEVGSYLFLQISKWGTSFLKFRVEPTLRPDGTSHTRVRLISEDIALLHKGYIPRIRMLMYSIVEKSGGNIIL